jgi:hypothetical protein
MFWTSLKALAIKPNLIQAAGLFEGLLGNGKGKNALTPKNDKPPPRKTTVEFF